MSYPIQTDRLLIEPMGALDAKAFAKYRSDSAIARHQSWVTPYTEAQAMGLIESQAGLVLPPKGEWLQLAIHLAATGELIGDLAIQDLREPGASFEIGFTIATDFQRQGYAKEAASALIEYLIREVGAMRFIATPDSRNLPSIKLLQSLGFTQRPEKSWDEFFKGENVTVDYFELVHTQ